MSALLTFALLVTVNLTSCRTLAPVPTIVQHDTVTMINQKFDSVYLRDSIYIREFTRNDTVYIERWRDRWKNHEIVRIDTIYQTQTLTKTETITAKEVPRFYKWCTGLFWLVVVVVVVWITLRIKKATFLLK